MKSPVDTLVATVPRCDCDPGDGRKRLIPIALRDGTLMMNRLRRLLRFQEMTKLNDPEDRFTLDVPNLLTLKIVEAYNKKSKAMGRMDKALDRKTERIASLEQSLQDQEDAFGDAIKYSEVINEVFGVFTDLLDAARDFSLKAADSKGKIPEAELAVLNKQITEATELLDDISEAMDEAEEEEKDDQS